MSTWQIRPAGDSALVVELEARVDPIINAKAIALAEAVRAAGHDGVQDVVSAYSSVTIYVDPVRTDVERLTERAEHARRHDPGNTGPGGTADPGSDRLRR